MATPKKRATIADLIQAAEIVSALDDNESSSKILVSSQLSPASQLSPPSSSSKVDTTHKYYFNHNYIRNISNSSDYTNNYDKNMKISTKKTLPHYISNIITTGTPTNNDILSYNEITSSKTKNNDNYSDDNPLKPPYSYAQLIVQAIGSSESGKLTLSNIYNYISNTYKFYDMSDKGWQNSIRHNLSLNKYFVKLARRNDETGKGSYWFIEPTKKDELLSQAFKKRRQRNIPIFRAINSCNTILDNQFYQHSHNTNDYYPLHRYYQKKYNYQYSPNSRIDSSNIVSSPYNTTIGRNNNNNSNAQIKDIKNTTNRYLYDEPSYSVSNIYNNQPIINRSRRSQTYSYMSCDCNHKTYVPCNECYYSSTTHHHKHQYVQYEHIDKKYFTNNYSMSCTNSVCCVPYAKYEQKRQIIHPSSSYDTKSDNYFDHIGNKTL